MAGVHPEPWMNTFCWEDEVLFSLRNSGGWGVETQSVCERTNLKSRFVFQIGSYIVLTVTQVGLAL